ncbi:aspartate aminotransferase [Xylariaceae sp. AK1471]|nr:aspartate aminotransferase [Xylariaceae sp. AK1471]
MGSVSNESRFEALSEIPLDPHHALKELFYADNHPKKVTLGSGVYRDDNSKPWVLPTVQKAEEAVKKTQDSGRYEYLPITGFAPFVSTARELLFGQLGDKGDRTVSLHTISGTGANFLGARFLAETLKPSAVWLSDPTWVNHATIWGLAGVDVKKYPYWDVKNKRLDFEHMMETLETEVAPGDVVLLHACAHNPTGVDPTKDQWKRVADVCEERGLFPFFDCAYQGFASGDLAEDAWAVRLFLERGRLEMAVAQSFSKNMGLYGERVGALHIVCGTLKAAAKAKNHLLHFQRGYISDPPVTGARLAATILSDPKLSQDWLIDLQEMSGRINAMRKALHDELVALGTPGNWDHIMSQIGMFSYTGLTPEQVASIQENSHVYILKSGRISVAGLNTKNVKHVAVAIDAAVRKYPA